MAFLMNYSAVSKAFKTVAVFLAMMLISSLNPYSASLSKSGMFDNTLKTAYPQTIVADMVEEHFNAPLPAGKTVKKCYIIGFDGARCDAVTVLKGSEQSGINTAAQQGGLYAAYCGGESFFFDKQKTCTAPGWASILTGEWADVHHVYDNGMVKSNDCLTVLTRLVEGGKAGSAAFKCVWGGHITDANATYRDEVKYTQDNNINVRWETYSWDDTLQAALLDEVRNPNCADIIFSIYERPDSAGHDTGFSKDNPAYTQAIKLCDKDAYDLIQAIQSRASYASEDWLIIITSDHGGYQTGHGTRTFGTRTTFIASNKAIISSK